MPTHHSLDGTSTRLHVNVDDQVLVLLLVHKGVAGRREGRHDNSELASLSLGVDQMTEGMEVRSKVKGKRRKYISFPYFQDSKSENIPFLPFMLTMLNWSCVAVIVMILSSMK